MKRILIFLVIIFCTGTLFADEKATDLLLGFFKSYDEEKNTITIMAAYQEMELRNDGVGSEALQYMFMSDMIEVGVYGDENGLVMTSLVNHGMPQTEEEFQEIIAGYEQRRNEIIDRG
jgi:hypothetical protein